MAKPLANPILRRVRGSGRSRAARRLHGRPRLCPAPGRSPAEYRFEPGRPRPPPTPLVAGVPRPGARRPDRRGPGPQLEREDRRRQRRGGRRRPDPGPRARSSPRSATTARDCASAVSEDTATPVPSTIANPQSQFQILAGASWEIDLWGRIRRQSEAARANLLATEEARRGVILSLVASGGQQLHPAAWASTSSWRYRKKTQATYAESLRPVRAPVQVRPGLGDDRGPGPVPVRDRQRRDPQLWSARSPRPRTPCRSCSGATRDPSPAGDGPDPDPAARPRRGPVGVAGRAGRTSSRPSSRLIAANAQIGAAKALYFPTISLTGALGGASSELSGLFSGPAHTWNYRRVLHRAHLHRRVGQRPGRPGRGGAEGRRWQLPAGHPDRLRRRVQRPDRPPEARRADSGPGEAGGGPRVTTYRLAKLQYNGGYVPYSTVLQADQQLFPGGAEPGRHPCRQPLAPWSASTRPWAAAGWTRRPRGRPPRSGARGPSLRRFPRRQGPGFKVPKSEPGLLGQDARSGGGQHLPSVMGVE